MSNNHWDKLKKENRNLREFIRIQALAMLAIADDFGDEVVEAIRSGARISYRVEGTKPVEVKVSVDRPPEPDHDEGHI